MTRAEIRAALEQHQEVINYGVTYGVHGGCCCGRFGPDDITDGHDWWLDHVTNQLHQKDNT